MQKKSHRLESTQIYIIINVMSQAVLDDRGLNGACDSSLEPPYEHMGRSSARAHCTPAKGENVFFYNIRQLINGRFEA